MRPCPFESSWKRIYSQVTDALQLGKSQRAYAIVFWFMLSYREGSAMERPVERLAMGMAIPRDAGGWASGTAAVSKGRMAREKECEKYISDRKC